MRTGKEEVAEEVDRVSHVEVTRVVRVGGIFALYAGRFADEEVIEEGYGVGDIKSSVAVDISALKPRSGKRGSQAEHGKREDTVRDPLAHRLHVNYIPRTGS